MPDEDEDYEKEALIAGISFFLMLIFLIATIIIILIKIL